MKVDLTQPINDLDGKAMKEGDKDEKGLTLGRICVIALSTPIDEDRGINADTVVKRWKLAIELHNKESAELTAEQMTELRNRIPKVILSPIAAGQACEMLKG